MTMTLNLATDIARLTLAAARRDGLRSMAVVVLDAGGAVSITVREDGGSPGSVDVALAKAATSHALRVSTSAMNRAMTAVPVNAVAIANAMPGVFSPVGGGAPIYGADGAYMGAAAASGDTADKDEACILEALAQLNLSATTTVSVVPQPWGGVSI